MGTRAAGPGRPLSAAGAPVRPASGRTRAGIRRMAADQHDARDDGDDPDQPPSASAPAVTLELGHRPDAPPAVGLLLRLRAGRWSARPHRRHSTARSRRPLAPPSEHDGRSAAEPEDGVALPRRRGRPGIRVARLRGEQPRPRAQACATASSLVADARLATAASLLGAQSVPVASRRAPERRCASRASCAP